MQTSSFVCPRCFRELYLLFVLTSMVASHICCFGCAPESRQACLDWSGVASRDLWESFTSQLSSTREPLPPTHTLQHPPPPPAPPLFLSSLCPSGRGLLLHEHSRQSGLWQAGEPRRIIRRILPSLRKWALFQVFHSTAPSHASCSLLSSGGSEVSGEAARQLKVMRRLI